MTIKEILVDATICELYAEEFIANAEHVETAVDLAFELEGGLKGDVGAIAARAANLARLLQNG